MTLHCEADVVITYNPSTSNWSNHTLLTQGLDIVAEKTWTGDNPISLLYHTIPFWLAINKRLELEADVAVGRKPAPLRPPLDDALDNA